MLLAASLLQSGAFLSQAIEFSGQMYYRPDFNELFEEIGITMSIDERISRILALSVVLPPMSLHAITSVLDERVGNGFGSMEVQDGGRLYLEPQGEGMLVFYMVLPMSVLGAQFMDGIPKAPRRRRRKRKPRTPEKQLAQKQVKLAALLNEGHYEQAAQLRDEIEALKKKNTSV